VGVPGQAHKPGQLAQVIIHQGYMGRRLWPYRFLRPQGKPDVRPRKHVMNALSVGQQNRSLATYHALDTRTGNDFKPINGQ
jgi:hypothetical protein